MCIPPHFPFLAPCVTDTKIWNLCCVCILCTVDAKSSTKLETVHTFLPFHIHRSPFAHPGILCVCVFLCICFFVFVCMCVYCCRHTISTTRLRMCTSSPHVITNHTKILEHTYTYAHTSSFLVRPVALRILSLRNRMLLNLNGLDICLCVCFCLSVCTRYQRMVLCALFHTSDFTIRFLPFFWCWTEPSIF